MPDTIVTLLSLAAMVFGFGAIIAVHEFGHFIAARWAGIRVHAFAVGFGHAILSYRKGIGLRRGSTENHYLQLLKQRRLEPNDPAAPSPTEYRLNWIPFGGYVKMLGQEDLNPNAASDAPDSYLAKPIWKRMVVISAGVVMNILLAAALFIAVYTAGINTPAPVLGQLDPATPAAQAGLQTGDIVTAIDGQSVRELNDAVVNVAMSPKRRPVDVTVLRDGQQRTVTVEPGQRGLLGSGLRQIGLRPATSATLWGQPLRASEYRTLDGILERTGIADAPYASTLIAVDGHALPVHELPNGQPFRRLADAEQRIDRLGSDGDIRLTFRTTASSASAEPKTLTITLDTERAYDTSLAKVPTVNNDEPSFVALDHLVGLTPLASVARNAATPPQQGLKPGDIFLRVGNANYPSIEDAITQIRSRAGQTITLTVLRETDAAQPETRAIDADVSAEGLVGFTPASAWSLPVLAATPTLHQTAASTDDAFPQTDPPAARLGLEPVIPGTRIRSATTEANTDPIDITDFATLRIALKTLTATALENRTGETVILNADILPAPNTSNTPLNTGGTQSTTITLQLNHDEIAALHELGWRVPGLSAAFRPVEVRVQADGPLAGVAMGFNATKRILSQTYLTLRRLVEGSVPVNKLQGPVGITYTGSRFAEQGLVYFLFFLALISANLAVINFLPIPITDGGQFLLLAWEGLRGKPAPIAVQNALTLVGLILIGSVFIYVTFHDILRVL